MYINMKVINCLNLQLNFFKCKIYIKNIYFRKISHPYNMTLPATSTTNTMSSHAFEKGMVDNGRGQQLQWKKWTVETPKAIVLNIHGIGYVFFFY